MGGSRGGNACGSGGGLDGILNDGPSDDRDFFTVGALGFATVCGGSVTGIFFIVLRRMICDMRGVNGREGGERLTQMMF